MIIFGGTKHFWYLQVLLNFKDDHVWICVTTEIQFATDHCSGSGLCTVRGNLKFYIFGDNLQLWYLPMSNLIISPPQISNGVFALIFFFTKVLSGICKTILCLNMYKMAEWSFVKNRYLLYYIFFSLFSISVRKKECCFQTDPALVCLMILHSKCTWNSL